MFFLWVIRCFFVFAWGMGLCWWPVCLRAVVQMLLRNKTPATKKMTQLYTMQNRADTRKHLGTEKTEYCAEEPNRTTQEQGIPVVHGIQWKQ